MQFLFTAKLALDFFFHIVYRRVHACGVVPRIDRLGSGNQYAYLGKPDICTVARPACVAPQLHLATCELGIAAEEFLERGNATIEVIGGTSL